MVRPESETMKKIIATVLIAGAVAITPSVTEAKNGNGQEQVDVCHDGDDGIELITVAEPAVDKLLARRDVLPGDSAGPNYAYGTDCSLVPVPLDYEIETFSTTARTDEATRTWDLTVELTVTGIGFDEFDYGARYAPDERVQVFSSFEQTRETFTFTGPTRLWLDGQVIESTSFEAVATNPCPIPVQKRREACGEQPTGGTSTGGADGLGGASAALLALLVAQHDDFVTSCNAPRPEPHHHTRQVCTEPSPSRVSRAPSRQRRV